MFGFFAGFLAGTGFGIYVAQKYEVNSCGKSRINKKGVMELIPDIKQFMDNFKETAKKYEKKDDKTS